jgi:hypothetical protein
VDDLVVASAASCGAVGGVLNVLEYLENGVDAFTLADSVENVEIAYVVALAYNVVFVCLGVDGLEVAYGSRICGSLPQTVEIAVSVNCHNLVTVAESEGNNGSITGLQSLSLISFLCLNGNPLNIMLTCHGVRDLTYDHSHNVTVYSEYGNMLLAGSFDCTGNNFFHFVAAAHYGHAAFLNECNDLAAMSANIKFLFHINSSLCTEWICVYIPIIPLKYEFFNLEAIFVVKVLRNFTFYRSFGKLFQ